MPQKPTTFPFTSQEHRISALPAALATIVVLALLAVNGTRLLAQDHDLTGIIILLAFCLLGSVYVLIYQLMMIPSRQYTTGFSWFSAIVGGLALGLITLVLPDELDIYLGVLMILAVIRNSVVSERAPSYALIGIATILTVIVRWQYFSDLREWTQHLSLAGLSLIMNETIHQLKNISRGHISRLEIINEFSRQITSSLNTQQVIHLLSAAIQNAVEADTYYVGLREGDEIRFDLFYDEGEYFTDKRVKLDGTLSGWVITNRKELFLPDLRREVDLPGVKVVVIGKDKSNLSWMGVPIFGSDISGVLVVASYQPNAFDHADIELLSNLAQHASLALDNTVRHGQVELQTQMDSLTGVYNHGYFLRLLKEQADESELRHRPLSLIMLDIDYFKQYNDTYGHLAGDEILTNLCDTIKRYLKKTDAVGRWGGEEFAISLPGASGQQALQVAQRIRQSMSVLLIQNHEAETIPVPTVSQGIAIYPDEAGDIMQLIDLADRRLYIAKERGRNQVEPGPEYWDELKNHEQA
jgi:diguanylate cyclase (GGDEF)-like protein